jgi:hypothetical protein
MSFDDILQFFVYRDLTPELTRPSHNSITKPNRYRSSEVALRAHKTDKKFSMRIVIQPAKFPKEIIQFMVSQGRVIVP